MTVIPSTAQLAQDAQKPLGLGDATIRAKQAAPEISPSTAVTVASKGGDITGNARTVAQVQKHQETANAAQTTESDSGGGLSSALSWLGHNVGQPIENDILKPVASVIPSSVRSGVKNFVSDASKVANVPLQTVQHEYRYLHDVEARHGMLAAFGEGLGIAAGAAVGGLVAGPEGIVLGAEGAGALEGQVLYKTSWQRTTTGTKYRDPHTGDVISIGRTIASAVGEKPGTDSYGTISGVVDGISDLLLTPLGHAGSVVGEARSAEGANGALKKVWGGTGLKTPEDIERAFAQYPSVRRAFSDISGMQAGDVVANYPKLAPIASRLEVASTPEEVKDVFKEIVTTDKLRTTDTLPTQTFMRKSFQKAREAMANYEGPLSTNFLVGPARWTRRFTNLPGASFDPETNDLSRVIDPRNEQGAVDVYRMVRYSQNEQVAKDTATSYVNAVPADRVLILRNAILDAVGAQAHFSPVEDIDTLQDWDELVDPDIRKAIKERLDMLTGGATPGLGGEYGRNKGGKELGQFYDPDLDRWFNAGILENHTGKVALPSFTEVKMMGKAVKGGRHYLSRLDDYFYNHVTGPFFKPLSLLTPSYAEHMVLAEVALNTWRQGGVNLAKNVFYSTAAKLGHKVDDGDANAFTGWLYRMMTRLPHNDEKLENAAALALLTTGHITTKAVSSGEATSHALTDKSNATYVFRLAAGKTPRSLKKAKDFGTFRPSDFGYEDAWRDWIREGSRSQRTQVAAKSYRRAVKSGMSDDDAVDRAGKSVAGYIRNTEDPDERGLFLASKYFSDENPPKGIDPIDNWGRLVAENFRGMIGKTPSDDIAKAVENGRMPSRGEMRMVDPDQRPETIKGRQLVPNATSKLGRVVDAGFNKILNPMIDTLSRQPTFLADFDKEMKLLKPSVDNGVRTYDEAVTLAASRATSRTVKFVHNIHTRTQWTETMRNWMPFAFAQEQAYKRAGRLLAEDPGAFRRYQLLIHGVGQYMAKTQSAQGTTYFAIPGAGILGHSVPRIMQLAGVPLEGVNTASFGGSLSAANVIFPLSEGFKPDTGPLAALAAKSMAALFPETIPGLEKVVGPTTISQPLWKMVIPNSFAQRAIGVAMATHTIGFANSMMQVFQNLDTQQNEAVEQWVKDGQQGPMPHIVPAANASKIELQDFIDKVRNQTRILYSMRAMIGLVSPIDPHVKVTTMGLSADLQKEITKEGSVSKGMTAFLRKHPAATPYTVSHSTTIRKETQVGAEVTGLPEGPKAMSWLNENKDLVTKYPQGSTWLMPQFKGTKYSSAVYNEQVAGHLRTRDTPAQFVTNLYIAAGDQVYYAQEAKFETALKRAGTTTAVKNHLYSEWTTYKRSLEKAAPIWADSFKSGQRTSIARDSINQLQEIRDSAQVPNDPQAKLVMSLLTQFNRFEAAYLRAGDQVKDYAEAQSKVKDAWYDYLHTTIEKKFPQLSPVAKAVFQYGLGQVTSPLKKT